MSTFKGGDIFRNKAFKHILSIGYELETSALIKFTEINADLETGEPIHMLLNTDSSQRDINEILENTDEENADFTDKEYVYRREEMLFLDVGKKDVSFHITNDMAESLFLRKLQNICEEMPSIQSPRSFKSPSFLKSKSNSEKSPKSTTDEKRMNYKNQIYKYKIDGGPTYDINFLQGPENASCATFSDVEWVATYYKPKLHSNIVLETFTNTLKILLKHLHSLKLKKGKFITSNTESSNIVVENTQLYHSPKTNLYYMKTTPGELDTAYTTIQMTFSAHVANIFFIMKKLTEDNSHTYEYLTQLCALRIDELNAIEKCTKHLIAEYNTKATDYKIVVIAEKTKILARDKLLIREIYNYIALILYKIYMYYNTYYPLPEETKADKYFKSYLPLNARHSNYQLYVELKRCLRILFDVKLFGKSQEEQNKILANIIKTLFVQHAVLVKYLLKDQNEKLVRKNAFNLKNRLEKNDIKNYGNPHYSLGSYFDFFEDPIYNKDSYEQTYDWFEYKGIDANSTKMKIKDNIILVEFRQFPRLLMNYVASVLDEKDRAEITQIVGPLTFKILEKFIRKYDRSRKLKTTDFSKPILSITDGTDLEKDVEEELQKEMLNHRPEPVLKLKPKPKPSIKSKSKKTRKFNKKVLQKQMEKQKKNKTAKRSYTFSHL